MNGLPTIISYRSQGDKVSCFLKLDDIDNILRESNYHRIKKIYHDIFNSITAYDPNHVNSLTHLEEKMRHHMHQILMTNRTEISEKKNWNCNESGLWIFHPIFLMGMKGQMDYEISQIDREIDDMNQYHMKISIIFLQMENRGLEKIIHAKPKEIKQLEDNRLVKIEDELFRLKSIPRIANSLNTVTNEKWQKRQKFPIAHQVAYARSLELQESLKNTHYVINHGQNLAVMIVNIVARKLLQEFEPSYYQDFEILRHDCVLQNILEAEHTADWFKLAVTKFKDGDHKFRNELIAADFVLESTYPHESAISFFSSEQNMALQTESKFAFKLLLQIVSVYIVDPNIAHKLCSDLLQIFKHCPSGGNLYSICVPKEKFDESCYFSRPYGIACYYQPQLKAKIEEIQNGSKLNLRAYLHPNELEGIQPQIRILAHKIRAEDGFYVILHSTLSADQIEKIETQASLCLQAALTNYRIEKRPSPVF